MAFSPFPKLCFLTRSPYYSLKLHLSFSLSHTDAEASSHFSPYFSNTSNTICTLFLLSADEPGERCLSYNYMQSDTVNTWCPVIILSARAFAILLSFKL